MFVRLDSILQRYRFWASKACTCIKAQLLVTFILHSQSFWKLSKVKVQVLMCASALRRIMSKDQNTITPTPCFWAQNTIHCLYVLRTPHCGHIKHGIKPPLLPKYQFPTCVLKIDRLPNYVRVRLSRSHRRKSQRVQASSACVEIVRLWIYKLRHLFAFTPHLTNVLFFTKMAF